ncbi:MULTISPECIES: GNAT family N-acetyltransferase [Bartonella]|uniref:Acetyltransferase n=1 Tax=Bartonella rochalimae ATCC BAA-1498 TaxID=685782 RepID=E6YN17_9HYPH|nr:MULTISPECIES: N-acetyltransferase [Bartonella]AQX18809.1 putative N-acetyltransferase YhbS [Bartonella sp. A1379B]AQX23323.1 putative N-acetyltransferase YhbS [Bartonella sp. 11B]AQX23339.1 putative N-acetyltransferase YhbS [Bartonella sp. 11B]AQX23373.1 putative N-acetyltransferase YhbS [Bartonella sp. 114]AQX24678.1 putative N-acetyltransferase YhbS [Bartonella sp. 114]
MKKIHFQAKNGARFTLMSEQEADALHREKLLDLVMGEERKHKSSEILRCGRFPAFGLSFVVKNFLDELVGSVRLWNITFHKGQNEIQGALLLGPLAVATECSGLGIGSVLMQHSIETAKQLGHGAIFLVGDSEFYQRFGFSSHLTKNFAMPGVYEKHRFQALELIPQYLIGCHGLLVSSGDLQDLSHNQHYKVA